MGSKAKIGAGLGCILQLLHRPFLPRGGIAVDGYRGKAIDLGPTEFKLLQYLLAHPGRVFSRQQLLNGVWGDHRFIEERTVDVYVRRLRAGLGPEAERLVETIRGVGYKLLPPSALH